MPSVSDKQHRLMVAVEHNPAFAKKVGIPQKVGADFASADKMRAQAKALRKHAPKKPDTDADRY